MGEGNTSPSAEVPEEQSGNEPKKKPRSKASFYLAKKKEENAAEDRAAAAKAKIFAEKSKGVKRRETLKSVGKGNYLD